MAEDTSPEFQRAINDRIARLDGLVDRAREHQAEVDKDIVKLQLGQEQLAQSVGQLADGLQQVRLSQEQGFQRLESKIDDMAGRDDELRASIEAIGEKTLRWAQQALGQLSPSMQAAVTLAAAVAGGLVGEFASSRIEDPARYLVTIAGSLVVGGAVVAVMRHGRR